MKAISSREQICSLARCFCIPCTKWWEPKSWNFSIFKYFQFLEKGRCSQQTFDKQVCQTYQHLQCYRKSPILFYFVITRHRWLQCFTMPHTDLTRGQVTGYWGSSSSSSSSSSSAWVGWPAWAGIIGQECGRLNAGNWTLRWSRPWQLLCPLRPLVLFFTTWNKVKK